MASSKKAFGQFVTAKRRAAGLTQLGLAERLFVTESAVSKWERGVSYPDISLVAPLAEHLGVSEGELIKASDDVVAAQVGREARHYRRWRAGVLRTTAIAYALALATCFIVNLAVDHTLSWFWIVLSAIAVAFSLTTLPLLAVRHRGLISVGAFLVSLFATFTVAWATNGGGRWLPIAIAAVLLAVVVLLGPIALLESPIPVPWSRHRVVLALGIDTVALSGFLYVVMLASDQLDTWWSRTVPITASALAFPWVIALMMRYLPVSRLNRAAAVLGFTGVYVWVFRLFVGRITNEPDRGVNLEQWRDPYIDGNVLVLTVILCLTAAAILSMTAAVSQKSSFSTD
jgi:transcriptional regulator with XRE-family HTH domain